MRQSREMDSELPDQDYVEMKCDFINIHLNYFNTRRTQT